MSSSRRTFAAFAIIVLMIAALGPYIARFYYYENMFNQMLGAYRARGEAILFEDLPTQSLQPEQNAAIVLCAAARSLTVPPEAADAWETVLDFGGRPSREALARVGAVIDGNRSLIDEVIRSSAIDQIEWNRTADVSAHRPELGEMRDLARFMALASLYQQIINNDHETAFALAWQIWRTGSRIDRQADLVAHLVAVGTRAICLDTLRHLATGLSSQPNAATRQRLKAIIDELLEDTERRVAINEAWNYERALQVSFMRKIARSRLTARTLFNRAAIEYASHADSVRAAALAETFPAAKDLLAASPAIDQNNVSAVLLPSMHRTVRAEFLLLADRRITATLLAIRLYQLDHDGLSPQTLDELVPAYLPQVPVDPFASDGQSLRYRGEPDPIVYSVGDDGIDDGGTAAENAGDWATGADLVPG